MFFLFEITITLFCSSSFISFSSFPINNVLPMHSNNSRIPSAVNAETHLKVPLIDFAYSFASVFFTCSLSYKSFLFPTIKTLTLDISRASFTSLYITCNFL